RRSPHPNRRAKRSFHPAHATELVVSIVQEWPKLERPAPHYKRARLPWMHAVPGWPDGYRIRSSHRVQGSPVPLGPLTYLLECSSLALHFHAFAGGGSAVNFVLGGT